LPYRDAILTAFRRLAKTLYSTKKNALYAVASDIACLYPCPDARAGMILASYYSYKYRSCEEAHG